MRRISEQLREAVESVHFKGTDFIKAMTESGVTLHAHRPPGYPANSTVVAVDSPTGDLSKAKAVLAKFKVEGTEAKITRAKSSMGMYFESLPWKDEYAGEEEIDDDGNPVDEETGLKALSLQSIVENREILESVLLECGCNSTVGTYAEFPAFKDWLTTFYEKPLKERLRSACHLIVESLIEESWVGVEDDGGYVFEKYGFNYDSGQLPLHARMREIAQSAVYPNLFTPVIEQLRAEIMKEMQTAKEAKKPKK